MPASHWVSELLDHYGLNRFNCPYMFCMVVMNADASWPTGGGRSINGGFNRGGALLHIPARALDLIPDVQTLLRHEAAWWAFWPTASCTVAWGNAPGTTQSDADGTRTRNLPSLLEILRGAAFELQTQKE